MSMIQNNHIYKNLVEYFRLEVSLNLKSQVNVRNALNNYLNCLPIDWWHLTRIYKQINSSALITILIPSVYLYKLLDYNNYLTTR